MFQGWMGCLVRIVVVHILCPLTYILKKTKKRANDLFIYLFLVPAIPISEISKKEYLFTHFIILLKDLFSWEQSHMQNQVLLIQVRKAHGRCLLIIKSPSQCQGCLLYPSMFVPFNQTLGRHKRYFGSSFQNFIFNSLFQPSLKNFLWSCLTKQESPYSSIQDYLQVSQIPNTKNKFLKFQLLF